mmetsp:Transcript_3350/g.7380  ORF Transcript_3350/g.7380 Transcript_3350/m.7380 type:complete len:216 (-) Transcript_3350:95-742(-)
MSIFEQMSCTIPVTNSSCVVLVTSSEVRSRRCSSNAMSPTRRRHKSHSSTGVPPAPITAFLSHKSIVKFPQRKFLILGTTCGVNDGSSRNCSANVTLCGLNMIILHVCLTWFPYPARMIASESHRRGNPTLNLLKSPLPYAALRLAYIASTTVWQALHSMCGSRTAAVWCGFWIRFSDDTTRRAPSSVFTEAADANNAATRHTRKQHCTCKITKG